MNSMWSEIDHGIEHSESASGHFISHSINNDYCLHHMFLSDENSSNQTESALSSTQRFSSVCSNQENFEKSKVVLQSGFYFGERSTSFKPTTPSISDDESDEDTIGTMCGFQMKELISFKDRSPNDAPAEFDRRVISRRINKIGYMGQNLSLGHLVGADTEDTELRPKPVRFEVSDFFIDEDSPMQIDVRWTKPENSDKFKFLTYNIEMKPLSTSDEWISVSSVKFPVFRIYHTDDKLLLGKNQLSRQDYDLKYLLRCQSQGEIQYAGISHILTGDWSETISVTFGGYEIDEKISDSSSL